MEPTFESHHSVEFDKSQHHIFDAEDVVSVLEGLSIESDPNGDFHARIEWIRHTLTESDGFGYTGLILDAVQLERIVKETGYIAPDIYRTVNPQLLEAARQLREEYEVRVGETVEEFNTFLQENPGMLLWSAQPTDVIDEIAIKTRKDGIHEPARKSDKLYINVDHINETYRPLVIEALSAV